MNKKIFLTFLIAPFLLAACTQPLEGEYEPYTVGNGPVLIEEFADFECPACGSISPVLKAYVEENPEVATLEYNHFPLNQHPNALPAAVAAECGGEQDRFWEVEKRLFENQDRLGEGLYLEIAQELELNQTKFEACLNDESVKTKILLSRQEGMQRGVDATPTLFVSTEGEEPEKVQFSGEFFEFIEQKAGK